MDMSFGNKIFASGGGVVAELLTAVTYPQFVLFKHVLCFARIMSYNTKLEMYSICEEFLDMAYRGA